MVMFWPEDEFQGLIMGLMMLIGFLLYRKFKDSILTELGAVSNSGGTVTRQAAKKSYGTAACIKDTYESVRLNI